MQKHWQYSRSGLLLIHQHFGLWPTSLQSVLGLQGNRSSATLMRLDSQDPHGTRPSHGGPLGLFGLFWQLRGDMCSVRPFKSPSALAAKATRASSVEQYVGCNATTLSEKG